MNFICDPGLVLYLPLHELDGSSFMSRDAYGHLCPRAGAFWTPRGWSFDGNDDYIDCGDSPAFNLTNAITIEAWIKRSAIGSTERIVSKRITTDAAKGYGWAIRNTNILYFTFWGIADIDSTLAITDITDWHHIAVTYDRTNMVFYLDTTQEIIAETRAMNASPNIKLMIGRRDNDGAAEEFSGLFGEVRVYNRALTPQEIQHNYLTTKRRYR